MHQRTTALSLSLSLTYLAVLRTGSAIDSQQNGIPTCQTFVGARIRSFLELILELCTRVRYHKFKTCKINFIDDLT